MAEIYDHNDEETSDRLSDSQRAYRRLVREVIQENLEEVIAGTSFIDAQNDDLVRVPLKTLRERRFRFGKAPNDTVEQPGLGAGDAIPNPYGKEHDDGGSRAGDNGSDYRPGNAQGTSGGEEEVDDQYELVPRREIVEALLEALKLPNMQEKGEGRIRSEERWRMRGMTPRGVWARLNRSRTARARLRRHIASGAKEGQRTPFRDEDRRHRRPHVEERPRLNALLLCYMDTSGSMSQSKRFLARTLFFLIVENLRRTYRDLRIVFVAHDVSARELTEAQFFSRVAGGGTKLSSVYTYTLEHVLARYDPAEWNIYAVHCSDGENETTDTAVLLKKIEGLLVVSNLVAFVEIQSGSSLAAKFGNLINHRSNFAFAEVKDKTRLVPAFRYIMQHEADSSERGR